MILHLRASDFQQYLRGFRNPEVDRHLSLCGRCRVAFDRAAAIDARVDSCLSALASPAEETPVDVMGALAQIVRRQPALAAAAVAVPWYRPFLSTPKYVSVAIHAAAVTLLMFGVTNKAVQQSIRQQFELIDPTLRPYVPARSAQGGGGGGAREPLPVSKGELPKPAMKQFVPPMIVDHAPQLVMEPTIVAPPDTPLPQSNLNNWGDPLAKLMNNSNGSGSDGGMGTGKHGGVGPGDGVGFGPGEDAGFNGGVFRVGGAVSAPIPIFRPDPEFSEEARKAKYGGTVVLTGVVDTEGRVRNISVIRSLGMGLDEKAVEAVKQWRFKPGLKNGQAVNVVTRFDVNFRLL